MICLQHLPFAVTLTVLLLTNSAWGQGVPTEFLRSTVLVSFEDGGGGTRTGSGFFLFRPIQGDQGHVVLVTNRHVLPPEAEVRSITLRVIVGKQDQQAIQYIEVPVVGPNGKYLDYVRVHPTPKWDIAVVNVTHIVLENSIQASWLPLNLLITEDQMRQEMISAGDDIYLLGYPDAIFDPRNISPIVRPGTIATTPLEKYAFNDRVRGRDTGLPDQIDGFLIDSNVFPGSSGSLVILKQQATTIGPQGQTVISADKKTPYILGIVSGSIPILDFGTIHRMQLGIVYSADAIRSVVEQLPK